MKIYRIDWHDPHAGHCYEWHTTKTSADKRKKELAANSPEINFVVDTVVFPTTKASIVAWLNNNFNTDNG